MLDEVTLGTESPTSGEAQEALLLASRQQPQRSVIDNFETILLSKAFPEEQQQSKRAQTSAHVLDSNASFTSQQSTASTRSTSTIHVPRIADEAAIAKTLPSLYHFCGLDDMIVMIAEIVQESILHNDMDEVSSICGGLTAFHSQ
ncbi:hypothetical protein S40288_09038 [Stachybotrys chartarum IBT 40288]|nr:hypothetical protein S40288_09038 [Stachybotrys chartarum IBT 40288]